MNEQKIEMNIYIQGIEIPLMVGKDEVSYYKNIEKQINEKIKGMDKKIGVRKGEEKLATYCFLQELEVEKKNKALKNIKEDLKMVEETLQEVIK